jgi:vacuolar-type H+-ATPase subunit C/Vma6
MFAREIIPLLVQRDIAWTERLRRCRLAPESRCTLDISALRYIRMEIDIRILGVAGRRIRSTASNRPGSPAGGLT